MDRDDDFRANPHANSHARGNPDNPGQRKAKGHDKDKDRDHDRGNKDRDDDRDRDDTTAAKNR